VAPFPAALVALVALAVIVEAILKSIGLSLAGIKWPALAVMAAMEATA
jgi:hypothetical protein